ncbi:MAG: RNA methyltransferase [Candidatus Kerfeldbacteria bacterium CG15_BIG_FIL_POST_REV_8_21_14_020_45_12]|uniref:RNA methyltransferase n=1 Tax=Candidatus Kerfeldbacteria bacterium CG15_BIG_FIL_POST_REV_8_21_14_020_45_12 TaxID=2014247 RepID=A0A2M7H547_9BACT|nr:MAG: RNA methyltransferase [Candidatus Kerfeldbacteria bacterium CG15_BIG_FIL_POST_REV_8_21_14_020_45_12]PJA94084.1 MAG: RNA methyltransferase [Candidatus Kerfeldbacteria bacterium CG_4_9_14_3_um_filter_45_8]
MAQRQVAVVLPSIRSAHNTGSFFRTADAAGVSKIYLAGYTAPPPHPHVLKVSLGAEESVPWEYCADPIDLATKLCDEGYQSVGVELTDYSVDFRKANYSDKVALWFGNEIHGLSPELQQLMDMMVKIPMHGLKESLNVSVAGGVMIYHVTHY